MQDIAMILHVGYTFFKKIKLFRETVNYPADARRRSKTRYLDGMFVHTMYFTDFLREIRQTYK